MHESLEQAVETLARSVQRMLDLGSDDPDPAMAVSVPYLMQFGYVAGGWVMARGYVAAQRHIDAGSEDPFYRDKQLSALYYVDHVLPQAQAFAARVAAGGGLVADVADDWFDRAY